VIASARTLIEPRVFEGKQSLLVDISPQNPLVKADRRRLKQMLLNLLSNAAKFTPEGGTITLRAYPTPDGLTLEVEDTGIGMSPEQARDVLKPFVQVDSGLGRRYEGTGLGLPLVASMAAMHGMAFSLTSSPEQGTLARLVFPAHRLVAAKG
jgi:signal transduction histidine kinase